MTNRDIAKKLIQAGREDLAKEVVLLAGSSDFSSKIEEAWSLWQQIEKLNEVGKQGHWSEDALKTHEELVVELEDIVRKLPRTFDDWKTGM